MVKKTKRLQHVIHIKISFYISRELIFGSLFEGLVPWCRIEWVGRKSEKSYKIDR